MVSDFQKPEQPPSYTSTNAPKPPFTQTNTKSSIGKKSQNSLFNTTLLAVHSTVTIIMHTLMVILSNLSARLDRVFPPSSRRKVQNQITAFSQTHPFLASFILAQLLFTVPPVLMFAVWAGCIISFAVATCVIVGLIVAGIFVFFVVGTALLFVVPAVIGLFMLATGIWVTGVIGWIGLEWVRKRSQAKQLNELAERAKAEENRVKEE